MATSTNPTNGSFFVPPSINTEEGSLELLSHDKHRTIEGGMAEAFSILKLLRPIEELSLSRAGWWFYPTGQFAENDYIPVGVSSVNLKLLMEESPTDRDVLGRICSLFQTTKWAAYSKSSNSFYEREIVTDKRDLNSLKAKGPAWMTCHPMSPAPTDSRDMFRIDSAYQELKKMGTAYEFVIQRLYANFYSGQKYLWNMDAVGIYRSHLVAFDFKHKYPDSDENISANDGISRLYENLTSRGICVVYAALLKPKNSKDKPAIEIIHRSAPEWLVRDAGLFNGWKKMNNLPDSAMDGSTPANGTGKHISNFIKVADAKDFQAALDSILNSQGKCYAA